MSAKQGPFYGKYRGLVADNRDPQMIGRVLVQVPDVLGEVESCWAMPCVPFAGPGMGFFALPAVGAPVWVEFEQGNPDHPIWCGGWWMGPADLPSAVHPVPYERVVIQIGGGHRIVMDEVSRGGGIALETAGGQRVVLSDRGLEYHDGLGGTVRLAGP